MGSRWRAAARACALFLCAALAAAVAAEDGPFPQPGAATEWSWPPDHPFARYRTLSPPDCVDASSMVAQHAPGLAGTYMRVENMGDPGTDALLHEIDRNVTWQLSYYTGLAVPMSAQRGYLDHFGQSGFQLHCADAGFFINTASFPHTQPIQGEGPNVSVGRDFTPGFGIFATGASMIVEADVRAPTLHGPPHPVSEGTAQLSFYVYYHDRTTLTAVAQLVGLLDSRPAGVNGSGVEWIGDDGHTAFIASPLATLDGAGAPVRFAAPLPGSPVMEYGRGWSETRHFGFCVSPANLAAALEQLRARGATISRDPADYVVTAVGLLGEVFPGTGTEHEVALGASVSNLVMRSTR